jgi:hypothetical protein
LPSRLQGADHAALSETLLPREKEPLERRTRRQARQPRPGRSRGVHRRRYGLPAYAQFDNDPVFQGTHSSPVAVGRVSRLCMSLGVAPVFVPPGEIGFQAMVEGYNRWWRTRV